MKTTLKKSILKSRFLIAVISFVVCHSITMAQTSWNTNGNTGSFSNFIGTTNNYPFLFRTNSVERMRIQPNGFVGIGVANPLQRLDVFGNIRVRGNIYVDNKVYQEGQFESDSIDAGLINTSDLSAEKINVDSLKAHVYVMNELSKFVGTAYFEEYLKAKLGITIGEETDPNNSTEPNDPDLKLEVKGGNARFRGRVITDGNSIFNGDARFNNGRMLLGQSQNKGIQVSTSSNQISEMNFGLINHSFLPIFCNPNSNPDAWHYNFNGSIRIYNWNNDDGSTSATATALNIGHDSQNGVIDLSQGDDSGADGNLLINTYCGKDVVFGKLDNRRGNVFINNKLGIGIGTEESNALLEIGNSAFTGVEYLLKVKNTGNQNSFSIKPDGKVEINCNGANTLAERLWVNGTIKAREVVVTQENWPDFVFDENYNLPKLEDTEKFIKENKHLPNVPSAKTVEENGAGVAEMQKIMMQKIEELTLHIIDLNKKIKDLENQKK
jgi:hypothetical protein